MQKTHIHFALSENKAIFLEDSLQGYKIHLENQIYEMKHEGEPTIVKVLEDQVHQLTELISNISATIEDGKDEDKYWD